MEERLTPLALTRDEVIKHWLLNLAIECALPLRVLFPAFHWPSRNAKEIPGVRSEDLLKSLLNLFDSGMIAFSSELAEDDL